MCACARTHRATASQVCYREPQITHTHTPAALLVCYSYMAISQKSYPDTCMCAHTELQRVTETNSDPQKVPDKLYSHTQAGGNLSQELKTAIL